MTAHNDLSSSSDRRAAKTTIVGGQPPGNERPLIQIPVGLERLLGMAAVNASFREALVEDWRTAAVASGFELTPTEGQIIETIGAERLRRMVAQVAERLAVGERRSFLSHAAAALVVLAGGVTAVASAAGCRPSRPSRPSEQQSNIPNAGQPVRRPPKPLPKPASRPTSRPTRPIDKPTPKPAGQVARPLPNAGMVAPRPPRRPVNRGVRPDRPLEAPPKK